MENYKRETRQIALTHFIVAIFFLSMAILTYFISKEVWQKVIFSGGSYTVSIVGFTSAAIMYIRATI